MHKPKQIATLQEIGRTIRTLRRAQGLRQAELAGYANVGVRFLIELEHGKPTIQAGKAIQVLACWAAES